MWKSALELMQISYANRNFSTALSEKNVSTCPMHPTPAIMSDVPVVIHTAVAMSTTFSSHCLLPVLTTAAQLSSVSSPPAKLITKYTMPQSMRLNTHLPSMNYQHSLVFHGVSVPGDFYTAIWHFVLIIIAATPLFALETFVQDRVTLAWRTHLTNSLVSGFFANNAYYRVVHMGQVDNPDQRITQDVAAFVQSSMAIISLLVSRVFNCVAFAGVLWSVSPRLVGILILYCTIGTWLTTSVFGRRYAPNTCVFL
jgi:ABC-type uncharacterized transport system fused permease/ATPase subunit